MFRLLYDVILRSETSLRQRLRPAGDKESLTMKDNLSMWGTLRFAQSDKITERILDNRYSYRVDPEAAITLSDYFLDVRIDFCLRRQSLIFIKREANRAPKKQAKVRMSTRAAFQSRPVIRSRRYFI